MRRRATPFFREVVMPREACRDRLARERFLLDTLAERRLPERRRGRFAWMRALLGGARRPS